MNREDLKGILLFRTDIRRNHAHSMSREGTEEECRLRVLGEKRGRAQHRVMIVKMILHSFHPF